MTQQFDTATVLALEVERTPVAGEVFNRLENPNGVLGGWGWNTPVPGSLMRGVSESGQRRLRYRAVAGTPNHFTSEPVPMQAGQWAAGRWDAVAQTAGYHRGQVEFLNLEGVVIGTSGPTGYLITGTGTIAATQAPAQTTHAQLRIDVYANATGGQPTGAYDLDFRRAVLATAATEAELGNPVPYVPPAPYTNILGPTHDLRINREELNVGTLVATVLDADLDPGAADLIRPGRKTRLRVITLDDEGAEVGPDDLEPLFTGRVLTAQVTYSLLARDEKKRARISLTAVDAANPLGAVRRAEGVATVDELPYVLEGAGVPWNVNGSGNQVQAATVVAVNENASALDQVAITRDTVRGYAWVDRAGILQAWDRDLLPATVVDTLDETVYNGGAQIDYDLAGCINAVTVIVTRLNDVTGSTDQVTFGPYRNETSIAEYGLQAADFTVQGIAEADVPAFAQAILDDNAIPQIRIQQVTCPIATLDHITARATRDLYDLVAVSNTRAGINTTGRVSAVEHSITPGKWLMTLTFAGNGAAAPPQSTPLPPPPATVRPLPPTGLALSGAVEFREGEPFVTLTADWDPVTQNTDDSALTNLDHYELQTKIGAPAGLNAWAPAASTSPDTTHVTVTGYPAGQMISARVRAANTLGVGSDWSAPVTIGATVDDSIPSQPSTPTTVTRLGVIKVQWDGLTSGGLPMESDFSYLEIHASTTNGFTPTRGNPNTLIETLTAPGYGLKTDGAYNETWYFRFIAVDTSGNVSPPSAQASAFTQPLVNTDLIGQVISGANIVNGSVTASDKIIGNTITGGLIQALAIAAGHIQSNAITADKIEAGAITTIKLAADAVTADKIAAGTITADEINASVFSAITIDASQITSGTISANMISGGSMSGDLINGGSISAVSVQASSHMSAGTFYASGGYQGTGTAGITMPGSIESFGAVKGDTLTSTGDAGYGSTTEVRMGGGGTLNRFTSSKRYKHDVQPFDVDDAAVLALPIYLYRRNDEGNDGPLYPGFLAEEAHDLGLHTFVAYDADGRPDGFRYSEFTVALKGVAARQQKRIEALESTLSDLTARLEALEGRTP